MWDNIGLSLLDAVNQDRLVQLGNLAYKGKVHELLGSRGSTLHLTERHGMWPLPPNSMYKLDEGKNMYHAIQHRQFRTSNTLPTETADLGQLFERLAGYPC